MPLYKNVKTGQERTVSDDYVSAFPAGTWEKLADEAPGEAVERRLREQEEAVRNKVELVEDEDEGGDENPEEAQLELAEAPPELPTAEPHGEGE